MTLIETAAPYFLLLVVVELVAARLLGRGDFEARDSAASLAMGFGNSVEMLAGALVMGGAFTAAWHFRIFDLGHGWWVWALLFLAEDLAYYWFHRLSHECRIWWASHVVHHSSQYYNLSTALRQTWTNTVSFTWLPWLPLAFLGFPPEMILTQKAISLIYQFWIHTETIDRMPAWFEAVFNTPSHHRVHHATNPRYLDANYAGILIIWDRLFGSFVEERRDEPCRYGIVRNLGTFNPLRIAFHEWQSLARDFAAAEGWRQRLGILFGPPGWRPDGSGRTSAVIKREWQEQRALSPAS